MSTSGARQPQFALKPLALAILLAGGSSVQLPAFASTPLPTGGTVVFGTANITNPNANTLNIQQTTDKAIINWETFDIARQNRVDFVQNNANSIALNRVTGVSRSTIEGMLNANGKVYLINKNGILFTGTAQINTGGLVASSLNIDDELFKNDSINTAINNGGKAAFETLDAVVPGSIVIENGAQLKTASGGSILIFAPEISNSGTIETPDGQTLLAAAQDKVYLTVSDKDDDYRGLIVEVKTGGKVTNEALGKIIAERGNITLLGLSVNQNGRLKATTAVDVNGTIRLLARDGAQITPSQISSSDVSKALGFEVEENGKLSQAPSAPAYALAHHSGTVSFGEASVTEIQADTKLDAEGNVKTAPGALTQNPSKIEVMGKTIEMQKNSSIVAPAGEVVFTATETPDVVIDSGTISESKSDARVYLAEGSKIDVSGLEDVELDMSRNTLEVELRGNELKDSPLQRDGILRGKKVKVDLRKGTSIAIADISGALAAVKQDVRERMTTGGSVNVKSTGDVVVSKSATIDVSGGSVKYKDGKIASTKLVSDGIIYDISDADPNRIYDSILGDTEIDHPKWNLVERYTGIDTQNGGEWVKGFTEGHQAGSFSIDTHELILDGDIKANTIVGEYQRDMATRPKGGTLDVSLLRHVQNDLQELRILHGEVTHDIAVDDELVTSTDDTTAQQLSSQAQQLQGTTKKVLVDNDGDGVADLLVSDTMLSNSGLSTIKFAMNGNVATDKAADMQLRDGASITLTGRSIEHAGNITAHGGSVTLQADIGFDQEQVEVINNISTVNQFPVHLAQGSRIDVSGRFTNDMPVAPTGLPTDAIAVDAGSVTLQARGALSVDKGAVIDADGGAWINSKAKLKAGKGGDVNLISRVVDGADVKLDGDISSYSLKKGGKLSIEAASIIIGDGVDANSIDASLAAFNASNGNDDGETTPQAASQIKHALALDNSTFTAGGFSAYSITANMQALVVDSTANLTLQAQNRVLNAGNSYLQAKSGTDLASFTSVSELPEYLRAPTDIALTLDQKTTTIESYEHTTQRGEFVVETGAKIKTDIGGNIKLQSDNSLFVDGSLDAAGGSITAQIVKHSDVARSYDATQSLWLGKNARLTSNAAVEYAPDLQGRRVGTLFDAGDITLWAQRGYLAVEGPKDDAPGAHIEASGAAFTFDNLVDSGSGTSVVAQTVAASAGNINLRAAEGILLDGELVAQRADVAGARGGSLTVAIDTTYSTRVGTGSQADWASFPKESPTILLDGARAASTIDNLHFGKALSESDMGRAELDANAINAMKLDVLSLQAYNKPTGDTRTPAINGHIEFQNGAALTAAQQIDLATTTLRVDDDSLATVNSAAIVLGAELPDHDANFQLAETPVAGQGAFVATANLIDVIGNVSVDQVEEFSLASKGDIRLRSVIDATGRDLAQGNLRTAGDIKLLAQQVYPTSLSDYRVASSGDNATITVAKAEGSAVTPLSAAGTLTLDAKNIDQQGVLRAPLGQIVLGSTNTKQVTLGAGSLTSVSADGNQIPLGRIQGEDILWSYGITTEQPLVIGNDTLPEKTVAITAAKVDLQQGSTVDISGNGDIYATEFIPGPGGSKDVLAGENAGASFAIIPTLKNGYAPYDLIESRNTSIELGRTLRIAKDVTLADGTLLQAGEYTVLPARYALQQGAFLVTPVAATTGIAASTNRQRIDGVPIVAGKQGVANTTVEDSLWSGYAIEKGDVALTRSEYVKKTATEFFVGEKALYSMPNDAGRLALTVADGLALNGDLVATHAAEGRGSRVDIAANNLLVTQDGKDVTSTTDSNTTDSSTTDGDTTEDKVILSATALSDFGADSILLGGTRKRATSTNTEDSTSSAAAPSATAIDVSSKSVSIADNTIWQGKELLLAATDSVSIGSNARMEATATSATANVDELQIKGDGALLQISGQQRALVTRSNEHGTRGDLTLAQGAQLVASQSIVLDASNNMSVDGAAMDSANLMLSSKRIVLGDVTNDDPANNNPANNATGVVLSAAQLGALHPDNLILRSRSDIAVASNIDITANNLALQAGNISSVGDASAVFNTAGTLVLEGNATSANVTADTGSLTFNAGVVQLGAHDNKQVANASLALDAASVQINATNGMLLDDSLTLSSSGGITASVPQITASTGAATSINAAGDIALETNGTANAFLLALGGLGSRLSLAADSIAIDTNIYLPAGVFSATASAGDITLGSNARLDVAGITQNFDREKVAVGGGDITLAALAGNVTTDAASVMDVSGSPLSATEGSRAGSITISAQGDTSEQKGEASLLGVMRGDALADAEGGEFAIDAKSITALDTLLSLIGMGDGGGAFTGAISVRQRENDIVIGAAQTITAHDIRFAADSGDVTVAGHLDASGSKGGHIDIAAGRDAVLQSGAMLDAYATSADGRGGKISISSGSLDHDGKLALNAGAQINVSGGDNSASNGGRNSIQQGEVHLRARQTGDSNAPDGVAVSAFDTTVKGADRVELEAFDDSFETSNVDSIFMADVKARIDGFMSHASDIVATLGTLAQNEKFQLMPGVEIHSTGDITVSEALDFSTWRYGSGPSAAPGVLTLRAAGNLYINQSISDGYVTNDPLGGLITPIPVLTDDFSWSFNLVGGADLSAASVAAVVKTAQQNMADVIIGADTTVRTGTGDIKVSAGGDVKFDTQTSVLYTAGHTSWYTYKNPTYPFLGTETTDLPYTGDIYQFFVDPQGYLPNRVMYGYDGGDIDIAAGNNVTLVESAQISTDWLYRYSGEVDYDDFSTNRKITTPLVTQGVAVYDVNGAGGGFQQGIATLGGGDINVRAGNDISHLSASAPVTIRQSRKKDYDNGLLPITGTIVGGYTYTGGDTDNSNDVAYVLEQNGGGDVTIKAGGNILSARVLADKGNAALVARGDIKADPASVTVDGNGTVTSKAYTMLSLSDATVSLAATGDIDIDAIYNTSLVPQSSSQTSMVNYSFSYSDDAGVELTSAAGDIIFSNKVDPLKFSTMNTPGNDTYSLSMFSTLPPRLAANAISGNIYIDNSMALFPSATGELRLLAKNNVIARKTAIGHAYVNQSDANATFLPSFNNPDLEAADWQKIYLKYFAAEEKGIGLHASKPVYLGNLSAATIIAAGGDIDGQGELTFYTAQKLYAYAGGDIINTGFSIQNVNASDTSVISAQGDITYRLIIKNNGSLDAMDNFGISMNGPGRLDLIAGGDINFGASDGVLSQGNNKNPALNDDGADINILAGIDSGLAYQSFVDSYLVDTEQTPKIGDRNYTFDLVDFVLSDRFAGDASALAALSPSPWPASKQERKQLFDSLSDSQKYALGKQALQLFKDLAVDDQRGFILETMYAEVRKGGIESLKGLVNDPHTDGTARSYNAIETLFPGVDQNPDPDQNAPLLTSAQGGDISLVFSQVATNDGGSINLFTPRGGVDVGLAGSFAGFTKPAADLGIRAAKQGDINAVAYGDINVNASRIFALDGGDIMLWSSQHDIDAGKGAKTALTLPPPQIKIDANGNFNLEFPAASSGSGIQAAVYTPDRKPGSVYLFAPQGVIDAGDAGISSAGDLFLVATKVLGADNISFGGVAIGVPTSTSIASSLTGASDAATASTAGAEDQMADKSSGDCDGKEDCADNNAVAFVTVEIIGLGD